MKKNKYERESAVYAKRWEKIQESLIDLEKVTLEAEAIWGKAVRDYIKQLQKCVSTLNTNLYLHLQRIASHRREYSPEQQIMIDGIIYASYDHPEDNAFSQEINLAVKNIEDFLRPRLKI